MHRGYDMTPYRILVGMDFSDTAKVALEQAAELALGRDLTELHAVYVLDLSVATGEKQPAVGPNVWDAQDTLRSVLTEQLDAARERDPKLAESAVRVMVHVRIGSPVDEIVQLAGEIGADLIVLGTHGRRGLQRLWLGSVAERVVRMASSPVLVVRPKGEARKASFQPEPACEDCLTKRSATQGSEWWCAHHEVPLDEAHRYRYSSVFDYSADPYNKVW